MFPENIIGNYSILLKNDSEVFFHIIKYIASFDNITHYNVSNYMLDTILKEDEKIDIEYNLCYKAPYGTYDITYKDTQIHIIYEYNNTIVGSQTNARIYEYINISHNNKSIIEEFVEDARLYSKIQIKPTSKSKFTKIFQFNTDKKKWNLLSKLNKRNLDSIYLNDNEVHNIQQDLDSFIESEDVYNKFGIPYKRNYLLYGIPGTGKTSLLFSLASHYDMSLAIVNFGPIIDDSLFMTIVHSIPDNSIFILEDIDALFIERHLSSGNKSMVSFSGILNTLDGIGRKNKLITFMTTNHTERLDPAILRPGRVDYKLEFTYASNCQIEKMYDIFINKEEHKKEFMKNIKNMKLTTCMLQKFLFDNRNITNINTNIKELQDLCDFYTTTNKNMFS